MTSKVLSIFQYISGMRVVFAKKPEKQTARSSRVAVSPMRKIIGICAFQDNLRLLEWGYMSSTKTFSSNDPLKKLSSLIYNYN